MSLLLHALPFKLGDYKGRRVSIYEETVALLLQVALAQIQDLAVHEFHCNRRMPESYKICFKTVFQTVAMGAYNHVILRRKRVQRNLDLSYESQGALAAAQKLAQIDLIDVSDHLVNGITAAAAP